MTKQMIGSIIVGLVTLNPAIPAHAFQSGVRQGGAGFTGPSGGGFTGPRGGGFTETLEGIRGSDRMTGYGRTPSFTLRDAIRMRLARKARENANQLNSANNLNQVNSANDAKRTNALNNANGIQLAVGWNDPYMKYHQGWVHGYWNGQYHGGFNRGLLGENSPGRRGGSGGELGDRPGTGKEMMGWGPTSWIYGPLLYDYGYATYRNPYHGDGPGGNSPAAKQPATHDYSRPIHAQSTPPAPDVIAQAASNFDAARQAFKAGDRLRAIEGVGHALELTPNDPALHEFRALTLFALKRYDEAAAALHAVLAVEPGWDWTTLIRLYGNPQTYTQQLLALETFTQQNPQQAPAHFVLAYHYLTEDYVDAAIRQLKLATAWQPADVLSAQLIQELELPQTPAATELAGPKGSTAAPSAGQAAADTVPAGKGEKIEGTWTAQPSDDTKIGVTFQDGGRFTWKVSRLGKDQQFQGKSGNENGILTLVQDQNNHTLVGYLRWMDKNHLIFKVMGAAPADAGLSFTKTS